MPTLMPTMPPPTQSTLPPTHPTLPLPQTLPLPLCKIRGQEFHGEAEYKQNYKKDNAYSGANRKIRIRNIFKHLNQLEKPKIRV